MNLSKVYGKKESDDHATSLFTSLQILFVSVLCTAVMACVDSLEFCLSHSASVHCTPGPLRLGKPSPQCMALSQTTLPIAQLTPLPSAPCSQTLLGPSPLACLRHWNTLCGMAWSPGAPCFHHGLVSWLLILQRLEIVLLKATWPRCW